MCSPNLKTISMNNKQTDNIINKNKQMDKEVEKEL